MFPRQSQVTHRVGGEQLGRRVVEQHQNSPPSPDHRSETVAIVLGRNCSSSLKPRLQREGAPPRCEAQRRQVRPRTHAQGRFQGDLQGAVLANLTGISPDDLAVVAAAKRECSVNFTKKVIAVLRRHSADELRVSRPALSPTGSPPGCTPEPTSPSSTNWRPALRMSRPSARFSPLQKPPPQPAHPARCRRSLSH